MRHLLSVFAMKRWRHTRLPEPWLELMNGGVLVAWGVCMIVASEPDGVMGPWQRADSPRLCLAALAPLWVWGTAGIMIGVARVLMYQPIERLRVASFVSAAFWFTVASLYASCVPDYPVIAVMYAFLAGLSGFVTIITSRRIGENGAS